jgi:hypothetical protein
MGSGAQNDKRDDGLWWDGLGDSPARDFVRKEFACSAAMVKRTPEHGRRMWTKYDADNFSDAEYEIVPGLWDHEHCTVCWLKIQKGDAFWQNSEDHVLCEGCYELFKNRG